MTLPLLLLALLSLDAPPALVVRVSGLDSTEGSLRLALFDSKEAWAGRVAPHSTATLPLSASMSEWTLSELPPGHYALKVFHDRNDNGELDRSERGRPSEPLGFSGGRTAIFGPPGWKKARVVVGPEPTVIEIELQGRRSAGESAASESTGSANRH